MNIKKFKTEEYLKRVLTKIFLQHTIKDFQDISLIRVTQVQLNQSLHSANVYIISLNNGQSENIIRKLNLKSGQIRHFVSQYWRGYSIPYLKFVWDDLPEYVENINNIIEKNQEK